MCVLYSTLFKAHIIMIQMARQQHWGLWLSSISLTLCPAQLPLPAQVANVAAPAVLAVYVLNANISFIDATVALLGWRLAETSEGQVNSFEASAFPPDHMSYDFAFNSAQ